MFRQAATTFFFFAPCSRIAFAMRCSLIVAALAASPVYAFPWMAPGGLEALMNHPDAKPVIKRKLAEYEAKSATLEGRQLGTGLVPGLVTLLGGTLTAVYDNIVGLIPTNDAVAGLKKFPERMYLDTCRTTLVAI
jgi:hypothetical protein